MGTQYVDDHRFMLCKGSTVTDITRAVSYTHLTLPTNSRV